MNIYLLNASFVDNLFRFGRWQGTVIQSGGFVEQARGNYIAFTEDYTSLKDWFENLVCKFVNGLVGMGGVKSIGKELWKGAILFTLNILLKQLDLKEMFIENETRIAKKYQVPDFFDEHKHEKLDPPWSYDARWNISSLESIKTMEKYNLTDSSPKNLQILGIISSFYHKTSAQELEM